jgi:glutamate racemase
MIQCSGLTWRNIKRIGLFDSGVGGLSVLRSLVSRMEHSGEKEFVYIGDTLRCPYGDRPSRQITSYVKQLTSWLLQHNIDAIIMACNTSTAAGKDELVSYSPVPVLDLIDPTAAMIAQRGIKKVGVLATAATARKQAFSAIIKSIDPTIAVTEIGCPLLVPVVEAGLGDAAEAQEALKPYVRELIDQEVEAIVYGCTHYPFLDTALKSVLSSMGNYPALIIDPADCLASSISGKSTGSLNAQADAFHSTKFATTGDAETFGRIASRCLKQNVGPVASVSLNELTAAFVLRRLQKPAITSPIQLIAPEAVG